MSYHILQIVIVHIIRKKPCHAHPWNITPSAYEKLPTSEYLLRSYFFDVIDDRLQKKGCGRILTTLGDSLSLMHVWDICLECLDKRSSAKVANNLM